MFRFTIRDVLWLTVVVAMGMAWWYQQRQMAARHAAELQKSAVRAGEEKGISPILASNNWTSPLFLSRKRLRIGDWVRVVRLPTCQGVVGGGLHSSTLRLYKRLIARGRPSRVFQIDEYGHPWIYCRFRRKDGKWDISWLAINDDSWVLVKSRKLNKS